MSNIVQLFPDTDGSFEPSGAARARSHGQKRLPGTLLAVRDEAGLARLIVSQRVPKHVAKQILRMMSEELLRRVNC